MQRERAQTGGTARGRSSRHDQDQYLHRRRGASAERRDGKDRRGHRERLPRGSSQGKGDEPKPSRARSERCSSSARSRLGSMPCSVTRPARSRCSTPFCSGSRRRSSPAGCRPTTPRSSIAQRYRARRFGRESELNLIVAMLGGAIIAIGLAFSMGVLESAPGQAR